MESRPPKRPFPFTINDILTTPPPPKTLQQGFLINQLLGLTVQEGEGAESSSNKKLPSEFVEKLECSVEHVAKFNYTKVKSSFVIRDVPADPEGLLSSIFKHCIDEAKSDSREKSSEPTHLGCLISSALLDGGDVFVPVRQITANTIDAILNLFTKVAQSKQQKGVTLWGEPFTITITTIDRSGLPVKRHIKGGARRRLAPVKHQIHEKCLIKATMVSKTRGWPSWKFFRYLNDQYGQRGLLHQETVQLMRQINAPFELDAYDADTYVPLVINHWNNAQQRHRFAVFIFGTTGHYKPLYKYGNDDYDTPLALYFTNNHFDGVQFLSGLFGDHRYIVNHAKRIASCVRVLALRFRVHWSLTSSENAKDATKTSAARDVSTIIYSLTSACGQKSVMTVALFGTFTTIPKKDESTERGCYIAPLEPKDEMEAYRFVAFDLETMQHLPVDPHLPERRNHEPNFIAAKVSCPACIENGRWKQGTAGCWVCGPHRSVAFCQRLFTDTSVDKQVVTDNPMQAFVGWLINDLPIKANTYAYSHFGGRFDMVITFRELFRRGYNPEMIRRGNKMYEMKLRAQKNKHPNIVFRDSFNLMPCALGQLVPAYGLDVVEKPFFPHMVNRPDNYDREIFPTPDDYLAHGMMPEKRRQFDNWYEQHRSEPFFLDEALASYCTNDVEILMAALVAFRREFLEITRRQAPVDSREKHNGIDVLKQCMTIASACMKHFRTNHLPAEHLAIVPERGYDNAQNQSLLALRFFKWYAEKHGVQLQTAHSAGGEKRVGNYSLDAWIEAEKRAIEVNGCVWHGCNKCFPDDNMLLPNGKSAGEVRERDTKRLEFLRNQVGVVDVYWECEIERMLASDPEMRQAFAGYVDDGPLEIRAAFMGGRTGPLKLFHKAREGEKISYYDFTSLYPFINFTTRYPIGHPKVHVLNEEVEWKCAEDNPYDLSLLKVWVIPPRQCDVPVLPVKVDDRLCFSAVLQMRQKIPDWRCLTTTTIVSIPMNNAAGSAPAPRLS
ncbi:hypothetical protein niasHT_020480 [Heterodera trifolii]|uniref:DNA-directed DNA polymerase n=1 Tax=Heterodera trifolii TaxID=157864 RepID=A0ABD2J9K8_9BILA